MGIEEHNVVFAVVESWLAFVRLILSKRVFLLVQFITDIRSLETHLPQDKKHMVEEL